MIEKVATRLNLRTLILLAALAVAVLSASFAALSTSSTASAATNRYWSQLYDTKAQCEASRTRHTTHWTYTGRCEPIGMNFNGKIVTIGYKHLIYLRYSAA